MANYKQIEITGKMKYDFFTNDDLASQIAFMVAPISGLTLKFGRVYDDSTLVNFDIWGGESVSYKWVERLVENIKDTGGEILGLNVSEPDFSTA